MDFLYPTYDDPELNIKIANKKEFHDLQTNDAIVDPEKESERLCNLAFELRPHQQFVKNFLSINTPYNSLLLYHGLGTGKTCSAIGVCEEMRTYMKQANISKRIIVVASPNVQENFKLQLFDDRKLKQINGLWNMARMPISASMSVFRPWISSSITINLTRIRPSMWPFTSTPRRLPLAQ